MGNTIIRSGLEENKSLKSNVSCDTEIPWSFGTQLINHLKASSFHGSTGRIQFDKQTGLRNNLKFLIVDRIKDVIDSV